jgi:hypothetical protein
LIFPNASGTFNQSFGIGGQPQDHVVPALLSMPDGIFSALGNSSIISSFAFNSTTGEKLLCMILLLFFQLNSLCQIQATLLQAHQLNNPPIGPLTSLLIDPTNSQPSRQHGSQQSSQQSHRPTSHQNLPLRILHTRPFLIASQNANK